MNSQETTKIAVNGLHNQFAGFQLPDELAQAYRVGIGEKVLGNKAKVRFTAFLRENKIENFNEIYNFYVKIKPQRQEGESDAELKNRGKFQKALAKYKPYFYNYDINVKILKSN